MTRYDIAATERVYYRWNAIINNVIRATVRQRAVAAAAGHGHLRAAVEPGIGILFSNTIYMLRQTIEDQTRKGVRDDRSRNS